MIYALFSGPSAASLGTLVCARGKLQVQLYAVYVADDGSCQLMDGGLTRALELEELALEHSGLEDEAFPLRLRANYCENGRRGSLMIRYDETRRIGLLKYENERPGKGSKVHYVWPSNFVVNAQRSERFLKTLHEIDDRLRDMRVSESGVARVLKEGIKPWITEGLDE